MPAQLATGLCHTFQGQVVGLGSARGPDDLLRPGIDQLRDLLSGQFADLMHTEASDLLQLLRGKVCAAPAAQLQLADYAHIQPQLDIAVPYLRQAGAGGQKGVNLFIHGAPGTGKTELARALAEALGRHGFRIVSGGTDNHIVLVDLRPKKITGQVFQDALETVGITINKNMIPSDPEKPSVTSGVRIGTTAVTQRGLREPEIERIAAIMTRAAAAPEDRSVLDSCKKEALSLISNFPLYPKG